MMTQHKKARYSKNYYTKFGLCFIFSNIPKEERRLMPLNVIRIEYPGGWSVATFFEINVLICQRDFKGNTPIVSASVSKWYYAQKKMWKRLGHSDWSEWEHRLARVEETDQARKGNKCF